jgi:hypothetical protein
MTKPTPCEHGKDKSWCVKCNRGEPKKPTPEEKWCEHNKNIAGKYSPCTLCHPSPSPEARVDWEKVKRVLAFSSYKICENPCCEDIEMWKEINEVAKYLQAAFEKGREAR